MSALKRLAAVSGKAKVAPAGDDWREIAIPRPKNMPVPNSAPMLQASDEFDEENPMPVLIKLAFQRQYEILKNTPLEPGTEEYVANAKLVLAASTAVTSTQLKVDENSLRKRKQDDLMDILKDLRQEEQRLLGRHLLVEEQAG